MKRILTILVFGSLACAGAYAQATKPASSTGPVKAAPRPLKRLTVKQILAKYRTALGSTLSKQKITSLVTTGTAEIPAIGATGTVEIYSKAPDKQLTVVNLKGVGLITDGYDGFEAWSNNPITGLRTKSGIELAQAKSAAVFDRDDKLETLYTKLEIKPTEQVDGKDTYVIAATSAAGTETWYFDAKTFLLLRQDTLAEGPQGKIPLQTYIEEYRVYSGIKVPVVTRTAFPSYALVVRISDVKTNVAIDDAKFKKPAQ
jgi:outer membrane lipoprotein-sorting protein